MSSAELIAIFGTTMGATNLLNSFANVYGKKILDLYWNRIYRSRRIRYIFNDLDPYNSILILINISMILEKRGYDTNRRKIVLPTNILYLISDPNFEHYKIFFDEKGNKIRDHIYAPLKSFIINSVKIVNNNNKKANTKLAFYPLTDGIHVYGFDVWTYQWFWGGFGEKRITPAEACVAMQETLKNLREFPGSNKKIRIMKMANNSLPTQSDHDKKLVKDYHDFCHKLIDPNYQHINIDLF